MPDHPQSPVAELKGQEEILTVHIIQGEVCPIVISVEEHILDCAGLRKEGVITVGRRGTSRKNVPSWDNSVAGISTGEAWPGDGHTRGEVMGVLPRPVSYSPVLVNGGDPQMFQGLKPGYLP